MKFVHLALLASVAVAKSDTDKKVQKEKDNRKGTGCKKGIEMKLFTDDDCSEKFKVKGDSNTVVWKEEDLKEKMDDVCHEAGDKSFHVSCQAGQGIIIRNYDNSNCAPLRTKKTVTAWDSCQKHPMMKTKTGKDLYVIVTGATVLKSAALALAAFAGSQF